MLTSTGAYTIIALANISRKFGLISSKYLILKGVPCDNNKTTTTTTIIRVAYQRRIVHAS